MTAWMELAHGQIGVHETAGATATPEIVSYFRDCGHGEIVSDEVAWCAAFVGAMLERAGIVGTRSMMARSYLQFGTPIDTARYGAIAVFRRGADESSGHVGFVTGSTATHILLLGGNQANAVSIVSMPRTRLLGLRWPPVPDLAADESRIVAGAGDVKKDAGKVAAVETAAHGAEAFGLSEIAQKAGELQGSAETLEAFAFFALGKGKWIAAGLAAYWLARMAWRSSWVQAWRRQDHAQGKTGAPT